jgi:hypothetical protein
LIALVISGVKPKSAKVIVASLSELITFKYMLFEKSLLG